MEVKGDASAVLGDSEINFLGKGGCNLLFIALLCSGYIQRCSIEAVSLVFHISGGISSKPAVFNFC